MCIKGSIFAHRQNIMSIKILVFGIAKDIVGGASAELAITEGMRVKDLKMLLEEQYPRLKQLSTYMIAVNNEYAKRDELISERDEIAIIPPVSGG